MQILLVCTGNICRSPMGEFLFRRYLEGTAISVCSAGTRGLVHQAMDDSSSRVLMRRGITGTSLFRSRRLTTLIAESSDLVLCFEQQQRHEIIRLAPTMARKVFRIDEFAQIAQRVPADARAHSLIPEQRLSRILTQPFGLQPPVMPGKDYPDPYGQPFHIFEDIAIRMDTDLRSIAQSIRG